MTVYRIEIDPKAPEDIDQATVWLAAQAPHKVGDWLEALEAEIRSLSTLPERCPLAPENGRWGSELELRQLLFDRFASTYRVIFTIVGNTVRVLQVRHGSRRYLFEED